MKPIDQNISKLIAGTRAGRIKWNRVNPTTYNWKTQSSDGTMVNTIVQKLKNAGIAEVSFRLWDLEEKKDILNIQFHDADGQTQNLLKQLYEVVSGNTFLVDDIFSDIVKDL
jgi:hypothetical protein